MTNIEGTKLSRLGLMHTNPCRESHAHEFSVSQQTGGGKWGFKHFDFQIDIGTVVDEMDFSLGSASKKLIQVGTVVQSKPGVQGQAKSDAAQSQGG